MIMRFDGAWRFLSNFYPSPLTIPDGRRVYPTAEHLFQACKTFDTEWAERIRMATTPSEAKRLGRKCPLRPDWEDVKIVVMEWVISIKFRAGFENARLLDSTGDHELVEGNTWGDTFWGVCNGVGENWLGRILMSQRAKNRQ